jgi:hypothetical protein
MGGERLGKNARNRLYQHYKNRENKFRNNIEAACESDNEEEKDNKDGNTMRPERIINGYWVGPLQIDSDDVDYVHGEVWRNRCCITGDSLGTVLELARWDMSKPSNCQNIVLLGVKATKLFDEALAKTGDGRNCVSPQVRATIEARLATCKVDSRA